MDRATRNSRFASVLALLLLAAPFASRVTGGEPVKSAPPTPHNQDRAPNAPREAAEAVTLMTVPPGFRVELFAAEPMIVNPTSMTFDAQNRVWITESVDYPRSSAGPGRDRVKILADSDGDGKADKVTVFADKLNIPSGIALGYGGVFLANAPDLLFLRDSDGDGRADTREVLLTGFGRTDTHELPSSLTWGPDGWLYGLNGVFNQSSITHQQVTHKFNCALWRYHPISRRFELFAEGTSNPWGLDYDRRGEFFVSACVIDHLWHLSETGYYHRQAGAYPPFTWKIGSIVQHRHQKAAYCGLCFYDGDQFPPEYRGRLIMGNIHGGCLNQETLARLGASYVASPNPDLLTAHDAWFMPVSQKLGVDGSLWILDWHDQYHCYQDARRDPAGIDRGRGRLYRLTYQSRAPQPPSDALKTRDSRGLLELLGHPNVTVRRMARQALIEQKVSSPALIDVMRSGAEPARTEALWTLCSQTPVSTALLDEWKSSNDPLRRAWSLRSASNDPSTYPWLATAAPLLAHDRDVDVRLAAAIASRRLAGETATTILLNVLEQDAADPSGLTSKIVWRQLERRLDGQFSAWLHWHRSRSSRTPSHDAIAGLVAERAIARRLTHPEALTSIRDLATSAILGAPMLQAMARAGREGLLSRREIESLVEGKSPLLREWASEPNSARAPAALSLLLVSGHPEAVALAGRVARDEKQSLDARKAALQGLGRVRDQEVLPITIKLLQDKGSSEELLLTALESLSMLDDSNIARELIPLVNQAPLSVRPQLIDLMAARARWSAELVGAVEKGSLPRAIVNGNQLRSMLDHNDADLAARIEAQWGRVRRVRQRDREKVVARWKKVLDQGNGSVSQGEAVFRKVCAQCHKYRGQGHDVGPDLTRNGRESVDQLLSNLLDPNLVIGKDYLARIVVGNDGRVTRGLVIEDSQRRLVLRLPGGNVEVFPRDAIESTRVSDLSLMPEDLEKQITEQEFRDLVAFLLTDSAKRAGE